MEHEARKVMASYPVRLQIVVDDGRTVGGDWIDGPLA